jgi:hypothetical protein
MKMQTTNMEHRLELGKDRSIGLESEKKKNEAMRQDMRGHHFSYGR